MAQLGIQAAAAVNVEQLIAEHSKVCDAVVALALQRKEMGARQLSVGEVCGFADASLDLLREKIRGFRDVVKEAAGRSADGDRAGARRGRSKPSRFGDGMGEVGVDAGVCDFYATGSCTDPVADTVREALAGDVGNYTVCLGCGSGIPRANMNRHKRNCDKIDLEATPDGRYEDMTPEWAVRESTKVAPRYPFLGMYTLESPLCYDVHSRMRGLAFRGDAAAFQPVKNFAFRLHRELMSLPKYSGTVFRAVDFKVSDSLYSEGALVTVPHQSSASEDPAVVKRFLASGGGKKQGSILILRTQSGRQIAEFSRYPEEREVLIPTNAQFRVVGRPDVGLMQMLECALEAELDGVTVAEMHEVDFEDWGNLQRILTADERYRNKAALDGLEAWREQNKEFCEYRQSKWTGAFGHHNYPPSTEMLWVPSERKDGSGDRPLLEYAVEVPKNHAVVALMVANLDMAGAKNREAVQRGLQVAAARNCPRATAALLSKGADPSPLPPALLTSRLALASVLCSADIVRRVQAALGDATFWQPDPSRHHWTALHAAADAGRADLLKPDGPLAGGNVHVLDADMEPPLFTAVRGDRAEVVRALVALGAPVDWKKEMTDEERAEKKKKEAKEDKDVVKAADHREMLWHKEDASSAAAQKMLGSALKKFRSGSTSGCVVEDAAKRELQFCSGATALVAAAQNGAAACVVVLAGAGADVNAGVDDMHGGWCAIHSAAFEGNTECLEALIEAGADVDKKESGGKWTALNAVSYKGHTAGMKLLVAAGADLNPSADITFNDEHGHPSQHLIGWTPLHTSCADGRVGAMRILLDAGARLDQATKVYGETPFYWACRNGNADIVLILLDDPAGRATANVKNSIGIAPLHAAAEYGHVDIVKILLSHGGVDWDGAASPAAFAEPQACWLCQGENGYTAMHFAAAAGAIARRAGANEEHVSRMGKHHQVIEVLLAHGVDPTKPDAAGLTPIATAARWGNAACLKALTEAVPREALDTPNHRGETPLWLAAHGGHAECVTLLVAAGADRQKAAGDMTPLDAAKKNNHAQAVDALACE